MLFLPSCWFNKFCMYIIEDFWSLSVFANCTLKFSGFLVVIILCVFKFLGNIFTFFCFFVHLIAKCRQSASLLCANVSMSSLSRAFLYPWYFFFNITLKADFLTLSRSSIFSCDNEQWAVPHCGWLFQQTSNEKFVQIY